MAEQPGDAARPTGARAGWTRRLHEDRPASSAAVGAAVAGAAVFVGHLVPGPWSSQPLFVYAAVLAFVAAAVAAIRAPSSRRDRWGRVLVADVAGVVNAVTADVVGEGTAGALVVVLLAGSATAAVAVRARRAAPAPLAAR